MSATSIAAQYAATVPAEPPQKRCKSCGTVKPLDAFGGAVTRECRECRRRRKPEGASLRSTNRHVEAVHDPEPARRMRVELIACRERSETFPIAWATALRAALLSVTGDDAERCEWRRAFRDMEPVWRAAYEGEGSALTMPWIPEPDADAEPLSSRRL